MTHNIEKVARRGVFAGSAAPDFAATTLAGETVRLSELRGKVVLVDFWATWCAPCVAEMPNVQKALDAHRDAGFEVLLISVDDDKAKVESFVKRRPLPGVQVHATGGLKGELAQLYNVTATPAIYLIDRSGQVVATELHGEKLLKAVASAVQAQAERE